MFSNLNAEMGRAKLSIKSLSELTGINYETLKLKFRGVTEFKLCEMVEIKRKAFPDKTLDYLFATDETGSEEGREQRVAETVERKPFKSIHIDIEKGIYLLNGEKVPMVSRIDLEFNNGKWSLLITRDELYVQETTKED